MGPGAGPVTGPGAGPLADRQGPGARLKADQKEFTIRIKKNKELHENLYFMLKVSEKICYGERDREPGREPDREQDQESSPVKI